MALYLVTGGAGFIGSHLVDALLSDGHNVRIIDNFSTGKLDNIDPRAEVIAGDVSDDTILRRAFSDIVGVFHLAAIASVQRANLAWVSTHRANLTTTIQVFDAAKEKRIPVVYASSAAVYGDCASDPLSEDALVAPISAYGADKLGCELHARVAGIVHGIPTVGFRLFNVFGPRQDSASPYSGVISIFCAAAQRGEALRVFGDGSQERDFIYVADVVAALRLGMTITSSQAPVFNLGTGRPVKILELANTIRSLTGSSAEPIFCNRRLGDIHRSKADIRRIVSLGWTPRTGLEAGVRTTLEWLTGR